MTDLRGKRIVVTGASSGIGFETARLAAGRGAEVCLVARNRQRLEQAVSKLGDTAWSQACDVSSPEEIRQLAEEIGSRWSAIDGLVNNAGVAPMAALSDTTLEIWDETFDINVKGPFLLCRELGRLLRDGSSPSVVNVSSTLAVKAIPGMAAYNSSKAALNQMTSSLALEWAPDIRVNAVMPAVVDTPIHSDRGMTKDQVEAMGAIHPLGRVGQPEEVANLIAFLLSERSVWMTGAIIPVDGGMLAT
jgi:NAD(P)-dependent dehydrogenase (short-subunit alcohol dehydrogenase family)